MLMVHQLAISSLDASTRLRKHLRLFVSSLRTRSTTTRTIAFGCLLAYPGELYIFDGLTHSRFRSRLTGQDVPGRPFLRSRPLLAIFVDRRPRHSVLVSRSSAGSNALTQLSLSCLRSSGDSRIARLAFDMEARICPRSLPPRLALSSRRARPVSSCCSRLANVGVAADGRPGIWSPRRGPRIIDRHRLRGPLGLDGAPAAERGVRTPPSRVTTEASCLWHRPCDSLSCLCCLSVR
jgi:hypothetical protein